MKRVSYGGIKPLADSSGMGSQSHGCQCEIVPCLAFMSYTFHLYTVSMAVTKALT